MLFNSYEFLFLFLPIVVIGYRLLARFGRTIIAITWLALASYVFYLSGETLYPWMLAGSILFNFVTGRWIERAENPRRKRLLIFGVVGNLALLGFFKYSNFAVSQFVALGILDASTWAIVLPIGISFFTFTQIAYLADVAARKTSSPDIVRYGLFVSYFPHLIAGPILHNKEMLPQFEHPGVRRLSVDLYAGLGMFAIGLAKKVLLADPCGAVASGVFGTTDSPPGFYVAWVGTIAYTLQIYFDFSGYSDMAIGISRMLGIDLPINFNSPYKSRSILEFWRRWHITLSRFLRDYLYIPLGGNRKGEARRFVNLFTTMLLGGIWHGAGWTFVIWGGMHGAAQTIAHGWVAIGKHRRLPRIPGWLGWPITMIFVMFAWVPFRSVDLTVMMRMWSAMLGGAGFDVPAIGIAKPLLIFGGSSVPVNFGSPAILTMAGAALVALLAPNSQQIMARFDMGLDSPGYLARGRPSRITLRMGWFSCLFVGILLGLAIRSIGGYSEFIYFQF